MKRAVTAFMLFLSLSAGYAQQNKFFMEIASRDIATFNDAIYLTKLYYNEFDTSTSFIENILWAASKKLFQVAIPIQPETINPMITRAEYAYWICKIFNLRGEAIRTPMTRHDSYYQCIELGIMSPGRGQNDIFTGQELLDVFSYLDYYIRYYKIKPYPGMLSEYSSYDYLPDWRKQLYKELDEQREREKMIREEKKKSDLIRKNSQKKNKKNEDKKPQEIDEKYIDQLDEGKKPE